MGGVRNRLTSAQILEQEWRAQPNNVIGGWCISLADDPRTPADGAADFGDFLSMEMAVHIVELHNRELARIGGSELSRRLGMQRKASE